MQQTLKGNNHTVLNTIMDATPDLIFYKDYLDHDGIYLGCNKAFTKFVGKKKNEIIGHNDIELFGENLGEFFRSKDREVLVSNTTVYNEEWVSYPDGTKVLFNVSKTPFSDSRGNIIGIVGIARDITELYKDKQRIEEQKQTLEDQKELYELVFKNTASSVLLIDIETNKFIDCNESAINILQCESRDDVLNYKPAELSPEYQPDGRRSDEKSNEMNALALEKGSHVFEWVHLTKRGKPFWVEVILTPIITSGKKVLHVVWKDISERKKAEKQIYHQAYHDVLTNLPNRILFNDRLSQAIERTKRHNNELAVFFIDLDHFKNINDSLGHTIGDEVLIEVTQRLNKIIRKEDTLARFGGDEFVLLVDGLIHANDATPLAQKILQALSEPLHINEHTLFISSSIGISQFPHDDSDAQKLIMYADSAMYKAKSSGRNNFQFYSADMTALAFERVTLETDLRKAIENNEFSVYYQPQINGVTNKLIGMEALVRWNHPTLGLVPPDKFIPLAEETGLIVPIDRWVMKIAMTQIKQWYTQGYTPGVLALNLAVKQLQQKDFMYALKGICSESAFKPEWLELEVTESQIMINPEESIITLTQISDRGVQIAVDDFGTGYSSLSYLKRLPIDKLKIDKSFVDGLPNEEEDAGIAQAIIALAKSLRLSVIAEGVETVEQKDFLIQNGCENIQGYFYGKPVPAKEFERIFLQK